MDMMVKIRSQVFETNSSSTHSLAFVGDSNENYTIEEIKKSFIDLGGIFKDQILDLSKIKSDDVEYGWGPGILNDFANKFYYAYLTYQYRTIEKNAIVSYVKDLLDVKEIIFKFDEYYLKENKERIVGYIDHESADMLSFTLGFNSSIGLETYLNSRDIVVVLDSEG